MQRIALCSQAQNFCSQTTARPAGFSWESPMQAPTAYENSHCKHGYVSFWEINSSKGSWKQWQTSSDNKSFSCATENTMKWNCMFKWNKYHHVFRQKPFSVETSPHSEPQSADLHVVQCLVYTWFKPGGFQTWRDVLSTPGAGGSTPGNLPELSTLTHGNPPDIQTLQGKLMTYLPANSLPEFQIQSQGSSVSTELSI